jgi:Tol biopolymer transport system component/DNA-binding winged helix-turn-helix (wHTH) protein
MLDTEANVPVYRFGSFELDSRGGELRKSGVRLKLQDQPRRILMLLLEHAGEVVTRDQIQRHLWPNDTFVDFDNAINSAVRKLRDVLGDTAENPRFIETLARQGYRFVAPVSATRPGVAVPPPLPAAVIVKKRHWRFISAAIVMTTLLAAGVTYLFQTVGKEEIAGIRVVPLTANIGSELHPSFSPDGTRIAYSWNGADEKNFGIYVKLIGPGDPLRITKDVGRDFSPAWSPDGRWIAALRDCGREGAIILIPASGGQHRELARVAKARRGADICVSTALPLVCGLDYWESLLAWSRDGKYLFTSAYSKSDLALSVTRISVETGEQRHITSPPAGIAGDFGPSVSPDGRLLAFVRLSGAKTGDVYVLPLSGANLDGGQARRLTFDGADAGSPVWTSDGLELIFSSNRGGRHELWRLKASGSAKPVRVNGMGEDAADLVISSNGRRLAYSRRSYLGSLWKIPIEAGKAGPPVRVTATTARDKFSHLSPDGKRIAFQSSRSGVDEIWVCDTDGANAVQLTTFGSGMSGSPRWSPDGKTIAFDSNVDGVSNIYLIRSDGGHPVRMTKSQANAYIPSWSRDGQWIYFASGRAGRNEIWKIRADGSSETKVTTGGGFTAVESTDGKDLYYVTDYNGELRKMPVGGGPATKVLDLVRGRMFTVTSKGTYFVAGTSAPELRYLDFASNKVRSIAAVGDLAHADVSQDEHWVFYPQPAPPSANLMFVENFH